MNSAPAVHPHTHNATLPLLPTYPPIPPTSKLYIKGKPITITPTQHIHFSLPKPHQKYPLLADSTFVLKPCMYRVQHSWNLAVIGSTHHTHMHTRTASGSYSLIKLLTIIAGSLRRIVSAHYLSSAALPLQSAALTC